MNDLLDPCSGLSPEQLGLLQLRLSKLNKDDRSVSPGAIVARGRDSNRSPLSFAQQRIWFAAQFAPSSVAHNVIEGVRLSGKLSISALEQAVNEVIRRHDVLRTSFEVEDRQPIQVVASELLLVVQQVNLEALTEIGPADQIDRLSAEDARRPFDLTRSPLLRVTLAQLGTDQYVVFLSMHHIIADFWSLGLLIRELASLYERFLNGESSSLAELTVQYRDYGEWQRDWFTGEVLQTQLSYWKGRLEGELPVLSLPVDGAAGSTTDLRGSTQAVTLSQTLSESLKSLSRLHSCTLTMLLLAAFKVLLYRLSGQHDIILGLTIANRNRLEVEKLIGFFVNTLALRTDLSGNPTFLEVLARLREGCLEAYGHQDLPFEKLVEEIRPERTPARNPVFDILFNSLTAPAREAELPGLVVGDMRRVEPESKFALTFNVEEFGEQIRLRAVHQEALFSSQRIESMLDQYNHLLQQIVDDLHVPISSYSIVAPGHRSLLPDPSAPIVEPHLESVPRLFASLAEQAPRRTAISQGDRTWSYRELSDAASHLAGSLRSLGFEKGDIVAVTGKRSFGLIAGMMAVLSGGGVLLTIDKQLPYDRRRLMARETSPKWLIRVGDSIDGLSSGDEFLATITVDPDSGRNSADSRSAEAELRAEDYIAELSPDDAAYIFFTSGTTGIPKAVLGCHKGLSHFLAWQRQEFSVGPDDRCAQLTSLSFDVVLRDIFLPLTSGATLCLPEGDELPGPERVLNWLEEERITLMHVVPTLAQLWLGRGPAGVSLRTLRWVFFAGEALTDVLVRRWRATFPQSGGIVNLYGPTETTLAKCFHVVSLDPAPGIQPIGRPIPETQALILTEDLQLCGIGEPGQIVLRTPFRSLGYSNVPAENETRFVRNPFANDGGDRLYLTGDLGRYRLDGSIEIAGRLDHQIKIRGVRVEPDEVTALLLQHPEVDSCAVVGIDDKSGEKALAAYIVRPTDSEVTSDTLRSYLTKLLPASIVPSFFVFLERLPLKPNGKLDRKGLPPPILTRDASDVHAVAPTAVEDALCKLWAEVLRLDYVGVGENFFELGGHSLLAMQLISRVREQLNLEVPLQTLFEYPTVAGLARSVERMLTPDQRSLLPRMAPDPADESIEEILAGIDQLSDQQVDLLISDLLPWSHGSGSDGTARPEGEEKPPLPVGLH
jgi:amino acid adenylation domain-containing protein